MARPSKLFTRLIFIVYGLLNFHCICNKDMCGLLNFHFIVIKMYVWLAEFSLYYHEDMCMACCFFVLDICMACCLFCAGYGLLFFFYNLIFKFK